jgi:hypothetical protein
MTLRVEFRVLLRYPVVNDTHLGLRLLQTEAGFDPSHRHGATSAPRAILFFNLPGQPYLRHLGVNRACISDSFRLKAGLQPFTSAAVSTPTAR